MKDYYSILEITIEASIEQIKKAYRKKAIEYHPDKHNGDKYFTNQFVEIKEAYDVLSDNDKRLEYDLKYFEYFVKTKSENKSEVKTKVKFQYKPHQKVYSFQERFENETSNVVPKFNHWGNEISSNADFFKFPKNIGKIISGHTTLNKDKNPSTNKEKQGCVVKAIIFSIIFSGVVIFGIGVSSTLWICFWALFPIIFLSWFASGGLSFEHTCSFIGVNGFAEFRCSKNKSNIIGSFEINYRDVTDVLVSSVVKKINFNYLNTYYSFTWLKGNEIVNEFNGTYNRENSPEKDETNYWLNCFAEKNWTIYLLDNMEKELELNGYILFSLYVFENEKYIKVPYIHLGVGFIKFITAKEEFVYNFNEIKKVYIKRSDNLYLYIEHSNYDRKFLFFESGNKSCIPLLNLSNQKYFFQAFELLLGYKFS